MAEIKVNAHGPLLITGDFSIVDGTGAAYDLGGRTVVGLCRCGASKNAPFCDGAHSQCGFKDDAKAFALPPKKS